MKHNWYKHEPPKSDRPPPPKPRPLSLEERERIRLNDARVNALKSLERLAKEAERRWSTEV